MKRVSNPAPDYKCEEGDNCPTPLAQPEKTSTGAHFPESASAESVHPPSEKGDRVADARPDEKEARHVQRSAALLHRLLLNALSAFALDARAVFVRLCVETIWRMVFDHGHSARFVAELVPGLATVARKNQLPSELGAEIVDHMVGWRWYAVGCTGEESRYHWPELAYLVAAIEREGGAWEEAATRAMRSGFDEREEHVVGLDVRVSIHPPHDVHLFIESDRRAMRFALSQLASATLRRGLERAERIASTGEIAMRDLVEGAPESVLRRMREDGDA